ncbi:hypothetical protein ACSBR1_021857 [Camellia fascicularis]
MVLVVVVLWAVSCRGGMDSQQDGYFTNLLQERPNIDEHYLMESQYLNQNTQKKPQRGGNFTIEEDKLLVSAWLNISLDAVHGNEQKRSTYWKRVWDFFHEHKKFESNRNENSLMNRWSTIQLAMNKFCGCYAQIESLHQSGINEDDKICKAKIMYKELKKSTFQFEHCWIMLRDQPKWVVECEKKKQPKKTKNRDNLFSLYSGFDKYRGRRCLT